MEIKSHTILVNTLPEYKILLDLTAYPETVSYLLAHENSHMNVAQQLAVPIDGYALVVSKDEQGFHYLPFVAYEVPHHWDRKKQIKAIMQIANAPDEYGNSLSPGDIETIEQSKNKLKKE